MCGVIRLYKWHGSFSFATWLVYTRGLTRTCAMTYTHVWHDSYISVTWLIHVCDMTHPYVWPYPCISVAWLMQFLQHVASHCSTLQHTATHSIIWHGQYVWHDSSTCVTWPMHKCGMTHAISATYSNTLQHAATHCNTLHHMAWLIHLWGTTP